MDVPAADLESDGENAFLNRSAADNSPDKAQQQRPVNPFSLPPISEAEELLRGYFTTVNLMVPFIHQDSFLAAYRKAQSDAGASFGGIRYVFATMPNL